MKILLIDDDPMALRLLARQLERLNLDGVRQFVRADDALSILETEYDEIDLVICDLQMPEVDGVEFVRHLARTGYRGGLVIVSGEEPRILHTVHRLAAAQGIHVLGALPKPVSTERLRQVLQTAAPRGAVAPRIALSIERDELLRAITGGELVTHFQPKVELTTGALVGAEALVRWRHPTAGLVFPDQFIPIAEELGLIDALTRAVLVSGMGQARRWWDAGLGIQVALNVSMDNLASLDFPDVVEQLARDAGVALSDIALEVTETRLMKDIRAPLDILARLRLKRISLSIDDFGTGHSSLAQLRDIPFDELKLDRSFVTGAHEDPARAAIIEGTLAMARQLGMKSVAEGVESLADWEFMRALGCDVAQGYFIARPMPGEDLPNWHAGWEMRRGTLTASGT